MLAILTAVLIGQQPLIQTDAPRCEVCGANTVDHYARTVPKSLKTVESAICRVLVTHPRERLPNGSPKVLAQGSGVLVAGKVPVVLTAAHVVSDAVRTPCVVFCQFGRESHRGSLRRVTDEPDAAAIVLDVAPKGAVGVQLAEADVLPGEHVYTVGFGGYPTRGKAWYGGIRCDHLGRYQITDRHMFEFSGYVRQGDSGAPVLVVRDRQPLLIGNLWGCGVNREPPRKRIAATRLHISRLVIKGENDGSFTEVQLFIDGSRPTLVPSGARGRPTVPQPAMPGGGSNASCEPGGVAPI